MLMIDPVVEELITLSEAARFCPRRRRGRKPHVSTVYRWATRGSHGILLETLRTPGGLCTTKEALQRFFSQLTSSTALSFHRASFCKSTMSEMHHVAVEKELDRRFRI
jgi:hypothetical protein